MKKELLFLGLMFWACASFAQKNNTPYDFPVKPGSQQWQSFKSVDDMYAACQVPQNVLSNLSTAALIQTCLHYPANAVLFLHNTPQMSFDVWKRNFNGITTLLMRNDAPARLLEFYNTVDVKGYTQFKTDVEKGQYTFFLMMIDGIIVQEEIINKMDATQKKQLLNKTLSNYNAIAGDELYGFVNHASVGRIIVKLAAALGDEATRSMTSSKSMQQFVATGMLTDREVFLQVIDKAKAIAAK